MGDNWSTRRRSGQAYGPGEYFSRGTRGGLHYSEGYAGGDAGRMLIIAWIMSYRKGACPRDASTNGACRYWATGHIVCNNPVKGGKISTGAMYCVPVAVVAFGNGGQKPKFKLNAEGTELAHYTSGTISNHPSKMGGWRRSSICSIQ